MSIARTHLLDVDCCHDDVAFASAASCTKVPSSAARLCFQAFLRSQLVSPPARPVRKSQIMLAIPGSALGRDTSPPTPLPRSRSKSKIESLAETMYLLLQKLAPCCSCCGCISVSVDGRGVRRLVLFCLGLGPGSVHAKRKHGPGQSVRYSG